MRLFIATDCARRKALLPSLLMWLFASAPACADTLLQGRVERGADDGVLKLVQRKYSIQTNFDSLTPFVLKIEKPQLDPFSLGASVFSPAAIRLPEKRTSIFLVDGKALEPVSAPVDTTPLPATLRRVDAHDAPEASFDGVKFTYERPQRQQPMTLAPPVVAVPTLSGVLKLPKNSEPELRIDGELLPNSNNSDKGTMLVDGEKIVSVTGKLLPRTAHLTPVLAPIEGAPISWDEWYKRFAELVRPPLVDAMLDANSPRGANTIRVVVTAEHRISVQIEKSANPEFDSAVIHAYETLQGNDRLQFPVDSRRSSITFLTDHTHDDAGECITVDVVSIKGDEEAKSK